jgi:hypothetical protein
MNNDKNQSSPESKSRWKKPLIVLGILTVFIICLFAAGMSQTDIGKAASEYSKNKADAEKAGLFFTTDEVEARYRIPESDNAAKLIESVLLVSKDLKFDNEKFLTEQNLHDNWGKIEPAISKIEEASHRKWLMFKRDFSNPAATPFPEFSGTKGWVKCLARLGHFAIEKGDYVNAEKYLNLASYLANSQDQEGLLIGLLVRIACLAIVEREIQKSIEAHGKEPQAVAMLERVMQNLDKPFDLRMPLRMEHWFAVTGMDDFLKSDSSFTDSMGYSAVPRELKFGKYLPKFKVANLSRIHRTYADGVQSIPTDCYDLMGVQKAFAEIDQSAMKQGLSYTMLAIVAPVFGQTGVATSKEIAQRNVLFQSLALLKSGADPAAGLPLKGRFALDIDGKPIRLKKGSSGWIVYSIWGDKVDDGGIVPNKMGKGDYVVHLPK